MLAVDLIVLAPLVLAPLAWVIGRSSASAARWIALGGAAAQLALLGAVWFASTLATGDAVSGIDAGFAGTFWSTAVDGLSAPLVALTGLIGLASVAASWRVESRAGAHFALLLLVMGAVAGVFLASNLLLFYVAWEAVLVPMFLLIAGWGSANAARAAVKFLVYTFAGGAVLLAGVVYVLVGTGTASFAELQQTAGSMPSPTIAFWLLTIGFLVKLPAVPVHTWLPDAHTEAPTAGSILLAGVLLKMGGYGLIRIALPFAPVGWEQGRWLLALIGIVGIVWGAATALVQSDLKRLVAYSSVAHMGFVVLAVSIGSPAALGAALVTMVSHGFVAGLLFFLVGALYERAHTRELAAFSGLGVTLPRWSVAFVFAALASAGLPALSGFPGEFVTLIEGFSAWGWWMLPAGVGVALAAAYNLRAVRETVHGPAATFDDSRDLDSRELATTLGFSACIVALGLRPDVVVGVARGALETISALVGGS